jgi:DNA-directed RNA polymerase specialized sigma24 family protein
MTFLEAYDEYFEMVYCFIYEVLKDEDQTFDVLADVFLHFARTDLTDPGEIKSFLYIDMRKTTLDYIRFKFKSRADII